MDLYTAVLLNDYEVHWSETYPTAEERDAAVREFALREYRSEPADYPDLQEDDVKARPGDVIEELGVLITVETTVTSPSPTGGPDLP